MYPCIFVFNLLKHSKSLPSLVPQKGTKSPLSKGILNLILNIVMVWLRPATKAPRSRPSPHRRAEENRKKQAETGGSGQGQFNRTAD